MIAYSKSYASPAEFMTCVAVEAAMLANVRAVVLGGWAQLSAAHLPKSRPDLISYCEDHGKVFFEAGKVPHGWLLPQCACAVIHGGAGTTGAVLRAGIPCIVTPVLQNDQHWWGQRVSQIGVGVGLKKQLRKTTAAELAAALQLVTPRMQQNAKALSEKIKAEDGVREGAAALAGLVGLRSPPSPSGLKRQASRGFQLASQLVNVIEDANNK